MNKPWFGRKKIGWGWGLPEKWQGWVVLLIYITSIEVFHFIAQSQIFFLFFVLFATIIFFIVIMLTSGKPQWGTGWKNVNKK